MRRRICGGRLTSGSGSKFSARAKTLTALIEWLSSLRAQNASGCPHLNSGS
jgi:hypothetical protein